MFGEGCVQSFVVFSTLQGLCCSWVLAGHLHMQTGGTLTFQRRLRGPKMPVLGAGMAYVEEKESKLEDKLSKRSLHNTSIIMGLQL